MHFASFYRIHMRRESRACTHVNCALLYYYESRRLRKAKGGGSAGERRAKHISIYRIKRRASSVVAVFFAARCDEDDNDVAVQFGLCAAVVHATQRKCAKVGAAAAACAALCALK